MSPTFTNFFAPGSGAKYAVPIIGDLTLIPSLSSLFFNTDLFGETTALVVEDSKDFEDFEINFQSLKTVLDLKLG